MAARTIHTLEFEGVTLTVEYCEHGNRLTGDLVLPSGHRVAYEISRDLDFPHTGTLWGRDSEDLRTPADRAAADRLFPLVASRHGAFRRPTRALRVAAWALAEPDWSPRRIALEAASRVPTGTRKEDFLPFLRAVLTYLDGRQREAFDRDDAAASFGIAGEQIQYQADFRRLTGRDFDPAADRIARVEVEALPPTPAPAAPAAPVEYECFECGATYPPEKAHLIDAGGMGCARCNH